MSAHPQKTVNQYRKARKLASIVARHGIDAETWAHADDVHRGFVLELAGYETASDTTWALVVAVLEDDEQSPRKLEAVSG